jgi:hypothetical protein
VLVKRRKMTMKNQSFSLKLEFKYDDKGIYRMEVPEINGKPGEEVFYVESAKDTYIGTIGTTIILTKKTGEEADPCGWVWNPILRRWFWRCWDLPTLNG